MRGAVNASPSPLPPLPLSRPGSTAASPRPPSSPPRIGSPSFFFSTPIPPFFAVRQPLAEQPRAAQRAQGTGTGRPGAHLRRREERGRPEERGSPAACLGPTSLRPSQAAPRRAPSPPLPRANATASPFPLSAPRFLLPARCFSLPFWRPGRRSNVETRRDRIERYSERNGRKRTGGRSENDQRNPKKSKVRAGRRRKREARVESGRQRKGAGDSEGRRGHAGGEGVRRRRRRRGGS